MSISFWAVVRTGLPHATIVVDHFHVVQLATKLLSTVRRRHIGHARPGHLNKIVLRARSARSGVVGWPFCRRDLPGDATQASDRQMRANGASGTVLLI
jgi:hypothetical protein